MKISEFENKKIYSEASGSMAVVDSNIKMVMNDYGLYEEKIINPNKEITEKAQYVSPNFNTKVNETEIAKELYSRDENVSFDKRIGYFQSLYAGYVAEGEFRENASSGGMGTWIFKELFEKDLIDYVIHVKKNENLESDYMFKYEISSSLEEIKDGAKTRYYPVEISEVMKKVKQTPGRYAIIGIPSFIYSIRLLCSVDETLNERIKYTVGLICGHQKSSKFGEAMAWQSGIQPGNLVDIDFRHKLSDRPASSYAVKMTGKINGVKQTIIKPTSELFGQNWGWGIFKPVASNYTDDVFNETADIVLGDAWLPEYTSDSKGNNIVIVRNPEIKELIDAAIESRRLKMDIVNKETIFESQSAHYRHTHDELAYRLYVKQQENEYYPKKRVKADNSLNETRKKIQDLRSVIAEQSHIQYQEALKRDDFDFFVNEMKKYTTEYDNIYKKIKRKVLFKRILKMGPINFVKLLFVKVMKKF